MGRGGKTSGPSESAMLSYPLYMLGAVEQGVFPSVDVQPEHQVTSDHEHQPELGCSGSDPHHLFPSFDSYCVVHALIPDRTENLIRSNLLLK